MPSPWVFDGLVPAVVVPPGGVRDATECPDRSICHTHGRGDAERMIPGRPYSVVAARTGRTSWTAVLDGPSA
jgi:hypothetical protein